jgi:hypothetical protein
MDTLEAISGRLGTMRLRRGHAHRKGSSAIRYLAANGFEEIETCRVRRCVIGLQRDFGPTEV